MQRPSTSPTRLALLSLLLLCAGARAAHADGFDAERFVPASGQTSNVSLESPVAPFHLSIGAGLFLNFADDAVVERDSGNDAIVGRPLDTSFTADLIASIGLWRRLELAVQLPLHLVWKGDNVTTVGGLDASGVVGDLRFTPKVEIWGTGTAERHFVLGFAVPIRFPTGDGDALRGSDGVTFEPRLLALAQFGPFGVTANVGAALRTSPPDDIPWGQEFTFALEASYEIVRDTFAVQVETVGGKHFSDVDGADLPLEILGGLNYRPNQHWAIFAGAGPGLTDGLGSPDVRIYAGVRFSSGGVPKRHGFADSDGDGILDRDDDCPEQAEDPDGYLDSDGCPEPDNDNDGVLDELDECPELPGAPGDKDGCPSKTFVTVQDGQLVIFGKVQFQFGSSNLEPKSEPLLDQIAVVLKGHPELGSIRIEGHTDNVGTDELNQTLSEERSNKVRDALISRGVAKDRLEAVGRGETEPVAPNLTAAGRAKNRRVEFIVLPGGSK